MSKFEEIAKKHIWTFIVGLIAVAVPFVKDVFKEGAESKYKKSFLIMLKSKESKEVQFDVADSAINITMQKPSTWDFVFDNQMFVSYVEGKETDLTTSMDSKMVEIQANLFKQADSIAKEIGIRADELIPLGIAIGKAFERGDLEVRFVRASF